MHPLILGLLAAVLDSAPATSVPPAPVVDDGQDTNDAAAAPSWTKDVEQLVREALAEGKLPGCVVAVGHKSGMVYLRAFGARAVLPTREPMTEDTIFDLASLTKPLATATSLMVLAQRGKVDLDEKVGRYLRELPADKANITLRQLLTHVSGLPAETPIADYERGRAEAWKRILAVRPKAAPGERYIYSDVGYLVLEEVIRRVTATGLDRFAERAIFRPLGMKETGFLPAKSKRPRIAPTEQRDDEWIRGQVHDPRAFRLGGVAGHAGLFATAADLTRFARMVLGGGALDGARVLSPTTMAKMLAPHDVPGGIRALGWDVQSAYSLSRGRALSRRAVGHGGYTGTSIWIDPEKDLSVIFLSNRVHPDGKGSVNGLAAAIATQVGTAFTRPDVVPTPKKGITLALGIDALAAADFQSLRGLRFALLTNDSARDGNGRRTTDLLAARRDLKLVALLSPEHGLSARRDERIQDGVDEKTRLPIYSLYGGAHGPRGKRPAGPRPVTLPPDIDAVLIDLPDVGTRFYTYASTVHAVLREAAARGLRVIVLDRPNPIGGLEVSGPMLKATELSPVNHFPLPVRHGMTMGELAEMMSATEHIGLALEIVRMVGYDRRTYFDKTGLPWWPPSPNLRTLNQTLLYPTVGLLEATNVSVGRGTDAPFELIGAPWLDGRALAASLAHADLTGISFLPTAFVPSANPHRDSLCRGVRLHVDERASFEPVRTAIAIAIALRRLHPKVWNAGRMRGLLGDPRVTAAILEGRQLADIERLWQQDLDAFRAKRLKYLLYPE